MPRRVYAWPIPKGITPHIHSISKQQLGTYQPNIPTTSPLINVEVTREIKGKGDDPKSEDKDSNIGGTAGAHVEDTTTNENTIAPSRGASLGTHVSETSQETSRPSRTVKEILGAHPIDDNFWDNTNPADVSVDTVNSEKQMAGSYVTKFHTHKEKQTAIMDLLCQEDQKYDDQDDQQLITHEHDTRQGNHNPSDPTSNTSVDHKLIICKDESFSSETMKNEDFTAIMGELTTVE